MYNCGMKRAARYVFPLSLFFLLVSCATPPPAMPPVAPPAMTAPVIMPPQIVVPPPILPVPEKTGMDWAIYLIKTNSSEINKFFSQNAQREIFVTGELRGSDGRVEFEIAYEFLRSSLPDAFSYGWIHIGFTVLEKETGTVVKDSFYWPIPASNAGILLSFDDDHEDVWETWLPTLEKYGARATFFVHRFTPFAEKALAQGHDIGFHTHRHSDLRNVSRAVFIEETTYDPEHFRVGRPMAFAYPYGFWEEWMHEELLQNFSILRGYGVRFRLYDVDSISNSFIVSTAIDNILYRDDAEFKRLLTMMLRTAKFLGGVLPLTTHDISDTAAWGIKTCRLLFLLQTAQGLNLNFYRFSDF